MSTGDFEIIDVHVHLFRDINHEKAASRSPGRRDRDRWGTPERIVPFMARTGISKIVFLSVFPTKAVIGAALGKLPAALTQRERAEAEAQIKRDVPEKIQRHNEWACSVGRQYSQLNPFIGIQPILGKRGMAEEVALRKSQGAKGVKLHPAAHGYYPDDRDLWPFYEACQALGMPIITDSAPLDGAPERGEYGEPVNFVPVLRDFPRLTLVLAHLGSAFWDERVELAKQFPNVYFDTSLGFSNPEGAAYHKGRGLSAPDAVRVIRKIGAERIMFGSDGPIFNPVAQLEEILALDLTEPEKKMILAENARRVLRI